MIFEAKTLQEVYQKASDFYKTSISELEIKTIQNPTSGFFGLFAKKAIIEITNQDDDKFIQPDTNKQTKNKTDNQSNIQTNNQTDIQDFEIKDTNIEDVIEVVKKEVNSLFKLACFDIENIEVKVYDDETILFEINGQDAALLIGKEGYRYNALATLLFTWITQKYGYKTKLEIASFLQNQEEMMRKFLEPAIREIEQKGRYRTKPFDGVLAYIALEILRAEFPHKYVAIKQNRNNENYIIVNEFLKKDE